MQNMWKTEKTVLTPTAKYFIEKVLGNPDLATLEQNAEQYVENFCSKNAPSPADKFFLFKISPPGIVGPAMREKILDNKERQAMEYVKQFLPEYYNEEPQKPSLNF